MTNSEKNITLDLLLNSLNDDFDKNERKHIFDILKNNDFDDDEALCGAKLLLDANNWDYKVLKKAFAKTEKRIDQITATKTKSQKTYLKYAAVLLPIGLFLGYLVTNLNKNKESIDTYYIKEEGLPNFMDDKTSNWDELMQLYSGNEMKKAYEVSGKMLINNKENDTAIYFQAVIAYELKDYNIAKKEYNKIILNPQSVFYHDAVYRLGFVLSHLQETKAAKAQFKKVMNDSNNPYQESAEKASKYFN
jgi:Spy/CpxP family protein refolding chaperone